MIKKNIRYNLIRYLSFVLIVLIGIAGVVFSSLFVGTLKSDFIQDNNEVIISVISSIVTVLTIFSIIGFDAKFTLLCKISVLITLLISIATVGVYYFNVSGLAEKITSVESLRIYVESFGSFAVLQFILIQFLQVVVLPIPSFITVAAGVLMFGAFYGALFSSIGIIMGSIVAFYIGRVWGYKAVSWLIGEKNLDKGIAVTRGKNKIIFSLMFLFPCFPDDILCFVAGITKLDAKSFILIVVITRIISIFTASYSLNNSLIPYDTWWGILLWILFFVFAVFTAFFIYKRGNRKHNIKNR